MRNKRNGQHIPENRVKFVEELEDAAGKRVPGSKEADETVLNLIIGGFSFVGGIGGGFTLSRFV